MMCWNYKDAFTETSAKKHDGVDTVFTVLVDQILQRPQVLLSVKIECIKKNLVDICTTVFIFITISQF